MRFLTWNMALSSWLLLSAFVLPQTRLSAAHVAVTAFVVLLFSFLAAGKPAARYVVAVVAMVLGASALLVLDVSLATALNDAIVGAVLFALSAVRPTHAVAQDEPAAHPAKP